MLKSGAKTGITDTELPEHELWRFRHRPPLFACPNLLGSEPGGGLGNASADRRFDTGRARTSAARVVRHRVLPGDLANTETVLAFLAREISTNTWLNLMDQYHPCYKAFEEPPLDRSLTREEYPRALRLAEEYGLRRLDQRPLWREWKYP